LIVAARLRVLLAEDSEDDVILTRRAFKRASIEVDLHVCEHGEAAIEYLSGKGAYADRLRFPLPDFVLLDWKLPRRNGFEVLTWIQQQQGSTRLPVVVISSSNLQADINQAVTAGATTYIQKPLNAEALLTLLSTLEMGASE
jgi:CheY-like chemotaxis protein